MCKGLEQCGMGCQLPSGQGSRDCIDCRYCMSVSLLECDVSQQQLACYTPQLYHTSVMLLLLLLQAFVGPL